jgi:AsmA family protein
MAVLGGRRFVPRVVGKVLAWVGVAVLVLVAASAVFVVTFDWNRARPWVDDKVSQALGRPFAINGDLRVGWRKPAGEHGWRAWVPWPHFSAQRVTIGNPDWARQTRFASVDELTFDVKVLPLIARTISVPTIQLVNPSVDVERLADGRNNWTFAFAQSKSPSRWTLELGTLGFEKGNIAVSDQQQKLDLHIGVDTLGKPIALGDVMKQQEAASRQQAASSIGKRGAHQLASEVHESSKESGKASKKESGQKPGEKPAAQESSIERSTGASAAPGAAASAASSPREAASGATAAVAGDAGASNAAGPSQAGSTTNPRDAYALGFTASGHYRSTVIAGTGKIGSVLALRDANHPYPLQADVKIGDTRLALVGTLTDPLHLSALDLRLWLQGESLSHLYPILGVTLPDTPPYATDGHLAGHLRTDDTVLTYSGFKGRVGGSDLEGTLTYERHGARPLLRGEVVSNLLRFEDLAPIIGADTNASKARRGEAVKQPPERVLPVESFKTDRWHAIDADVKFTGRRIVKNPQLPFTDLYTHVVMKDGALTLQPLKFGYAGGTLASDIDLDGSAVPLKARMSLSARHLKLKQLFPSATTMQSALGELNGDAALSATGNSPAALASTLDGEAKAIVTEGKLSRLLMEAAGLNVANIVYEKLFGHREVNIHCGAADFVADHGVLDSRTFALDTDDALIAMDGHIDLRNESMDLTIHPHTKGLRVVSLRSPLYVKGTFKHPDVGVSKGALALRAGAAVALGLVNPFAALIPLIVPNANEQTPCAALVARMRGAPSPAPGGGKTAADKTGKQRGEPAQAAGAAPAQDQPRAPSAVDPQRHGIVGPGQGG